MISKDARSLLDLSPDGRLVAAYGRDPETQRPQLGIIDISSGKFRSLTPADHSSIGAQFSIDGKRVLFFHGRELRSIEISTGSIVMVGKDVDPSTPVRWLNDGRAAYLDRSRRLMFARAGKSAREAGLRVPDPPGDDSLAHSVSVSPDGSRVLSAESCGAVLTELASKKRTPLGSGLEPPLGAWSPAGNYFVLQEVEWSEDCRLSGVPPVYDILFDGRGKRIANLTGDDDGLSHGHSVDWSRDEKWLFLSVQPTGSSVTGHKYLRVVSLADMRVATVLPDRLMSALAGPNDRIVYARFRRADASDVGDFSGTIHVGRLAKT